MRRGWFYRFSLALLAALIINGAGLLLVIQLNKYVKIPLSRAKAAPETIHLQEPPKKKPEHRVRTRRTQMRPRTLPLPLPLPSLPSKVSSETLMPNVSEIDLLSDVVGQEHGFGTDLIFEEEQVDEPPKEILEEATVRFRQDAEVVGRLALAYAENGRTFAAAKLFSRSTKMGGDYSFAAAEYCRLTGRFRDAIRMNALISDNKKRLSQRLAIYLGNEAFDRATALTQRLQSANAMNDTNRYRLAYVHLRVGDLDRAEALAIQISDPAMKQRARDIREQVAKERER